MTKDSRPDAKPAGHQGRKIRATPDSDAKPDPLSPEQTNKRKPKPDGDAIAEVGDEIGGPA